MIKHKKHNIIFVFILLVSLAFLCACTQQKKPAPQQETSQEDEDKPPKELDKLKESIEKMEKELESIHEEKNKPLIAEEGQGQQQNDKSSSESGQGQQSQEQGQGQSQDQQGQSKTQEQNLTPQQEQKKKEEEAKIKQEQENIKKFESLKKDVTELHSLWNSYEPKAVTAYAQPQTVSGFETTLNNLTQIIPKNDDFHALLTCIELSKYLSDFYSLYKTDVPSELDKYRFAVKKIKLLSEKESFDNSAVTYKYLEDTWGASKPKLPKEVNTIMHKFEFALKDLKNAINAKSKTVVIAKCEMFITLIDELEKSIKEAKEKEEQK